MRFLTGLSSLALLLSMDLALAQTPPAPEPLFRRVAPPAEGDTGPRINIQIEPREEVEPEPEPPLPPVDVEPDSAALWFWSVVPTQIGAEARFFTAIDHLALAPEVADLPLANLALLTSVVAEHGADILINTAGTEVSPALVLAVIAVESSGRVDAVSGAGAQGLMQLIPATAARFGVEDTFEPAENIAGGVAYLDWLLAEFDGDPLLALAGYNAGEGAVRRAGGVPNYAETREYVPKVLATWQMARALCTRPPVTVSDPCLFANMTGG